MATMQQPRVGATMQRADSTLIGKDGSGVAAGWRVEEEIPENVQVGLRENMSLL